MSEPFDFIDAALQYEVSPHRYPDGASDGLLRYGTSVGAIRGTVRDLARRYPGMAHDQVTALSSELWAEPVFERRLAAVVLLQGNVSLLVVTDLTRIEGFIRSAGTPELTGPLVSDVLMPLVAGLHQAARSRALTVIRRWAHEPDAALRSAALALLQLQ